MSDMYELYNECYRKIIDIEDFLERAYKAASSGDEYHVGQRALIKDLVEELNLEVKL